MDTKTRSHCGRLAYCTKHTPFLRIQKSTGTERTEFITPAMLATTLRASNVCDEESFSSPEECASALSFSFTKECR